MLLPSGCTTKTEGSTSDATAWVAWEKSAMACGLNPLIGPDDPSIPTTTVPAPGGVLGTDDAPLGAIGGGRLGGVQAASTPSPATRTAARASSLRTRRTIRPTLRILTGPVPTKGHQFSSSASAAWPG